MKRYDLIITCGKRAVRCDSWGVVATTDNMDIRETDAEAMEQLGRRLLGEARALRKIKEQKAA